MTRPRPSAQAARHLYQALATDGDGTLMRGKTLGRKTAGALERLRATGRKLVLTTGENPDQLKDFPRTDLFDLVVAENGAILYWPESRRVRVLAPRRPPGLVHRLKRKQVEHLRNGRVIVSTRRPSEGTLREAIDELGIDWQVVFNRQEVMALPRGVDKATGLAAGLQELGLTPDAVVGVGDAENDVALLRFCGCGVAVAGAVPLLAAQADVVMSHGPGAGVVELVERILAGELPTWRASAG